MRRDAKFEPVTVDQFLAIDFGSDRKFELLDGVIHMMAGGTVAHALISGNIFSFLRHPCEARPAGPLIPTPASW
jgi:Putative restriction endonuclease